MGMLSNRLKEIRDNKRKMTEWYGYRVEYTLYHFISLSDASFKAVGYIKPEQDALEDERISTKYNLFS